MALAQGKALEEIEVAAKEDVQAQLVAVKSQLYTISHEREKLLRRLHKEQQSDKFSRYATETNKPSSLS
jgi:hypothetical protein